MKVSEQFPQNSQPFPKPDMEVIVSAYIPVKKMGTKLMAKCPFHNDDTPSFAVYEKHAHCFGCGWHGDGADFIAEKEGIDVPEALKIIRERYQETTYEQWPDS